MYCVVLVLCKIEKALNWYAIIFLISSTIEIYRCPHFCSTLQRSRLRFIRNNTSSFLVSRQCMRLPRRPIHSFPIRFLSFVFREKIVRRRVLPRCRIYKRKVEISLSVLPNPLPGPSPLEMSQYFFLIVGYVMLKEPCSFCASKTRVTS